MYLAKTVLVRIMRIKSLGTWYINDIKRSVEVIRMNERQAVCENDESYFKNIIFKWIDRTESHW